MVAAALGLWWVLAAPPAHHVVAPAYEIGAPPDAIAAVARAGDDVGRTVTRTAFELPGYDDIVLQEARGRAFATAVDGFVWTVDLATGHAERLIDVPLMPAGARAVPGDPDRLLFCAARYGTRRDHPAQAPGLYELTISIPEVREVAIRVPREPAPPGPATASGGRVVAGAAVREVALADLTEANSRPVAFCNDLDVGPGGRYVYFSEPFDYPGASMGPGAVAEAITLARNGRLWRVDRERETIALVAERYTFLDGVLIEPGGQSVLITETPKFRLLRLHVAGPKAGTDEIVWESLPGMPDGLDRDGAGRIWIGLVRMRTPLATWVHAHPWVKPLLLRLPAALLPVPHDTGILALSPDAATPLYLTAHDGSRVAEIAVVVPGAERLYLPSFALANRGLVTMPYPPGITPPGASAAARRRAARTP